LPRALYARRADKPAAPTLGCVASGRKNYQFAGSDACGRRAVAIYSLIESDRHNGVNPQHNLADVLARIPTTAAVHCRTPALELATARSHPPCRPSLTVTNGYMYGSIIFWTQHVGHGIFELDRYWRNPYS
jgi:hypothetical protein